MAGQRGIRAGKAYVELYADNNRLSRGLKAASAKLKAFGASVTAIGTRMASLGAMIVLPFAAGAKVFSDFETQMANVSTMLDNPEKSLAGFTKAIRDMAIEFGESTEALAGGLYDILSASIDASDAIGVLEVAVKAAKGGMTDTAVAADAITTMINAYGLSAKDAADVSDLLFSIVKRGKTTFAEIAPNIGKVATIAASAGVSLEELGASLSAMTRNGVRTENAMIALQAIITSFLKPTTESAAMAKSLGFELSAAAIKSEGLASIFEKIGRLSPDAISKLFPNVRALRGVLPTLRNITGFLGDIEIMGNRTGVAETAFDKMAKTLGVSYKKAKESVLLVASAVGESLAKSLKTASKNIVSVSTSVAQWIGKNQGIIVSIAKLTAGMIITGVALIAFGGIVSGIGSALGLLATGIGVLKVALLTLATPIGLVVATLGTLGYVLATKTKAGGEAVDKLGEKFSDLKDRATKSFAGISAALQRGDIVMAAKILWLTLKQEWAIGINKLKVMWEELQHFLTKGWIETIGSLRTSWALLNDDIGKTIDKLSNIKKSLEGIVDRIKGTLKGEIPISDVFMPYEGGGGKSAKIETEGEKQIAIAQKVADEKHLSELEKIETEIRAAKDKLTDLLALSAKKSAAGEFKSPGDIESDLWGEAAKIAEKMFPEKALALAGALGASIDKVSVAGTFNPMAAFGLGGGNAMDRTAVATEKTARNTAKILDESKYNSLAFQ